jgi:hypothetical protein
VRGSRISLKTCISITKIGGNAKVVKKAVAPAIRKGSFFNNSFRDFLNRPGMDAIEFRIVFVMKVIIEPLKIERSPVSTAISTTGIIF